MEKPILVGAVAYSSRVVPIWDGMRDYFRATGTPIDYVLYSNYDRQVQALFAGQIDIAWNTNLAWIKVHRHTAGACRALAMRDVDARFTSVIVASAGSGIESLTDLRGKRLALGSADSVQAAILPAYCVHQAGVEPARDCQLVRFDLDVGKHGDTGTSELAVLESVREGRADAGALAESYWNRLVADGKVDPRRVRKVWTSPGYCHCNFTALADFPEELGERWTETLLGMDSNDPRWRELMEMEGLKRWIRPDSAVLEGYDVLFDAVDQQGLAGSWRV